MSSLTNSGKTGKNILFLILLSLFVVLTGIFCFYRLDEAGSHNWDEARHIVNAYEMISSGNLWIHTYLGDVDYYNFKPPLSMWCILFFFKLFGAGFYSMRLYSAVATFLLFLIVCAFLYRNFGRRCAIIFGLLFITGEDLFFFHMARSADADALYVLLFSIAMLCLFMAEKRPWYFCLCCFFLSLAFLAKCFHMASGIAIIICYLPRVYKQLRLKHYIAGGLCLAIPTGIWAIVRFLYDGLAFFAGMMGQEVVDRIEQGKDYTLYIQYFLTKPLLILPLCITAFAALFMAFTNHKSADLADRTALSVVRTIISHKLYLFFLWFLIPFCVYSISGAFLSWYIYICYIPFYIICSFVLGKLTTLQTHRRPIAILLLLILVIGVCFQTRASFMHLNVLSYENNTDIRYDLIDLMENSPSIRGSRIYIENSRNEYLPQNVWEQNCIADAYIAGDLKPVNGGVPMFIEDEDGLLIISKDLFATYSSILAGRVILVDGNDYLIFCNQFY